VADLGGPSKGGRCLSWTFLQVCVQCIVAGGCRDVTSSVNSVHGNSVVFVAECNHCVLCGTSSLQIHGAGSLATRRTRHAIAMGRDSQSMFINHPGASLGHDGIHGTIKERRR
jgi:hypothetical protein